MNFINNRFPVFALTLIAALTLTISACETDPCKDVECGVTGTCLEGDCICDVGYELDGSGQCSVRSADKFVSAFNATEDCSTLGYVVTVTASNVQADKIILTNLGNYDCPSGDLPVEATVNGSEVTLLAGPYCPTTGFTGYTFSGSGTVSGDVLTISYVVTYTVAGTLFTDTCVATLNRQ